MRKKFYLFHRFIKKKIKQFVEINIKSYLIEINFL